MRVLLVVLLAAQVASAGPSKEVTRSFQAGVDAFRLGNYAEARAHLERAKQLDPTLPGPHRFLAAVAQAQGRFADCVAAARVAIELNPTSQELADTRTLHDDCRRAAGRPTYAQELGDKAAIGVTANVAGATVKISGLVYGATPLPPRPIPAGTHDVELAKAGYLTARTTVKALVGIVTDLHVELAPDPAAQGTAGTATQVVPRASSAILVVLPDFDGVVVRVDGAPATLTPVRVETGGVVTREIAVAPGVRVLDIRRHGNDPWRRRVHVGATTREDRDLHVVSPVFVDTAARERIRTRGLWLVGVGAGLAVVGGVAAFQITRSDRAVWKGIAGTSFGAAAVVMGVGIWALVRGQRPDLTAPPPFAVIPVENGALASTGLRF